MKMIPLLLTVPVLALAPVAQAQEMTPADTMQAPSSSAPAATQMEQPMQQAPQQQPAMESMAPAAPASDMPMNPAPQASAAPANAPSTVQAAVDSGFPKYDLNKDGKLSESEFKSWVMALKTDEMKATGQPVNSGEVSSYASSAWASADTDKDMSVTRDELTGFLGG